MLAADARAKLIPKREARLAARMPQEIQERIQEAATLTGSTINEFLVSAALDKANAVLERERIINLNFEAAQVVLDMIANPPEPNEALRKAMLKRRAILGNSTSPSKSRPE